MRRLANFSLMLLVLLPSAKCLAGETVTTESLLHEMVDMVGLANFPDPEYKTIQFSSYDRRSNLAGGPEWFANSDGFGNEPIPNFEAVLEKPNAEGVGRYLICDVKGPGAIVRTWTAAISGTIRVTLDDQEQPLFDGPSTSSCTNLIRRWRKRVRWTRSRVWTRRLTNKMLATFQSPLPNAAELNGLARSRKSTSTKSRYANMPQTRKCRLFDLSNFKTSAHSTERSRMC